MGERKQDALSTNFLIGLMDDAPKHQAKQKPKRTAKKETLHVGVRPQPQVAGDRTLEHLASRIVEEVTVSSSPRQLANQVLNQAGIETRQVPSNAPNAHLRHVGQRSRKIPHTSQPKIRRVKRAPTSQSPVRQRRGPPVQTRTRPAVGTEHEVSPPPRRVKSKKSSHRKQSRRGMFRR
jgi:hypothetical protein